LIYEKVKRNIIITKTSYCHNFSVFEDGRIMRIKKLVIENVKGIGSKEFDFEIHPNKPTFFVAPNGYGKTSIATAFDSLKRSRIELQDEQRYQNNADALPLIKILDEAGNEYLANSEKNTISDMFSICVINSQLKTKATTRNIGGHSISSSSLVVNPIVLYKTIPNKCEFIYSFTEMKEEFGCSAGKLLINLTGYPLDSG
jgi:hypothetical protein